MKLVDLTGKEFTYLTVMSRATSERTSKGYLMTVWNVKCKCGTARTVNRSNLTGNVVRSCGRSICPFHLLLRVNQRARGEGGLRWALHLHRHRAKRRKIDDQLSDAEVFRLFKQHCFYCGSPPSNVARSDSVHGMSYYSGIDRIDSKQGYLSGNVRPCCWTCNKMKSVLTEQEFSEHIKKLYVHLCLNTV